MMHLTVFLVSTLALAAGPQATSQTTTTQQAAHDHAQMNHRGAQVMGFDQDKTTHHFLLFEDGGAIDVSVKDAVDKKNLDAIRAHLPHIAMKFGQGDFDAPALVHATAVPGTKELAALKDKLTWKYVETPKGGRVDISTTDPAALSAVHAFLKYQIEDHKTGDGVTVKKRRS
jgi:hypothetical protein